MRLITIALLALLVLIQYPLWLGKGGWLRVWELDKQVNAAHEKNDETLERIYIGRRFKNDTERLEKLFELYTQMTANLSATKKVKTKTR